MAQTSTNMSLTLWNSLSDPYDSSQLVDNWVKVDKHDHTSGNGKQIPFLGIDSSAIADSGISSSTKLVRADDLRLSNGRPPDYADFSWTATGSNPTYSGSFTSTAVSSIIRQSGTFTGTATITLPPANQLAAGSEVIVQAGSNVNTNNTISVVRSGTNTINGTSDPVIIGAAYGFRRFITDGSSSWVYDAGVIRTSNFFSLTFGSIGLKATSGSSPWNGSAAATIDIDNTKVPTISGSNTVSFITSGATSLTLPTSGTVLTTTNNQILTNKSLSDSTTYIVDSTDNTKRVNIDVTGTTGITGTLQTAFTTAKTIAFPDTAGTVITSGDTNTVTNTILKSSASVDSDRAVTTNHIKDNAINSAKILDGSVGSAEIATDAVTSDELSKSSSNDSLRAVTTNHIRDNAITTIKLPDSTSTSNGVTTNKMQYSPAAGISSSYVLSGPANGTSGAVLFRQIIDSDISDPAVNVNNGINGAKIKVLSIPANRLTGVPWGPKSLYVNGSQNIPVIGPTIGDEIYYPAFGTANIISSGGNDAIRITNISSSSVTFKPTNTNQSLETIFGSTGNSNYIGRSYTLNCAATGINSATAQPFNSNVSSIVIDLIDNSGIYYPPQIGNFISGVGIVNGTFITDVTPDQNITNRYSISLSANTNSTQNANTSVAITGTGFDKTSFTIPGEIGLQAYLYSGTNIVTLTNGETTNLSVGQKITQTSSGPGQFTSNATIASILSKTSFTTNLQHSVTGNVTFDVGRLTTANGSVTVPLNNANGISTQSGLNQICVITEVPKQLWHLRFSGPGWHYVGGTPLSKRYDTNYNPRTTDFVGAFTRNTGGWFSTYQSASGTNTVPNGQIDVNIPIKGTYKVDISATARIGINPSNSNGASSGTTLEYSFATALATLKPSKSLSQYTVYSNVYLGPSAGVNQGNPLSYTTWLSNPNNYTDAYTNIYISSAITDLLNDSTSWSKWTRLYFQGTDTNGYKWFVTNSNFTDYDGYITGINEASTIVTVNRPIFIGNWNSNQTTFTPGSVALGSNTSNPQYIEAYSWKKIGESDLFATATAYSNTNGSSYATAAGTTLVNLNQTKNEARVLKLIYSVSQGPSNQTTDSGNGFPVGPIQVAHEVVTVTPVTVGYTMSNAELLG